MTVPQCLQEQCLPVCWRDHYFSHAVDGVSCSPGALFQTTTVGFRVFRISILVLIFCGCREQLSRVDSNRITSPEHQANAVPDAKTPDTAPAAASIASETSKISFKEMDRDTIPAISYTNGQQAGEKAIIESLGGGVGICDTDGDGWLDIVLPRGGSLENREVRGNGTGLLRNLHGRFTDVSEISGLMVASHFNHGAAATDLDHDGFCDLLITGYGGVQLFRNLGDGSFEDITRQSRLNDPFWSSSAAWGDFNGDRNPDVYIAHYVDWSFDNHPQCFAADGKTRDVCPPRQFSGVDDALFLSDGSGEFLNQTIQFRLPKEGKGLAVLAADIDQDNDIDVYVSNDTVENFLLLNDAGQGFSDVSQASGSSVSDRGTPDGSMSIDFGDYNNDGQGDLWVSNYEREAFALYRNQTGSFFRHVSDVTGINSVAGKFVGWGAGFCDADLDGDEDILAANGHVQYVPSHAPYLQRMLIFDNQNETHFTEAAGNSPDLMVPRNGRGLSIGDLDRDGRPDMVVSQLNMPTTAFRNTSTISSSFLNIELTGTSSSRHAVGAVIYASTWLQKQWRAVKGGGSYSSSFAPEAHFGIPGGQRPTVEIRWPDGKQQQLGLAEPGRRYRAIESATTGPARLVWLPE